MTSNSEQDHAESLWAAMCELRRRAEISRSPADWIRVGVALERFTRCFDPLPCLAEQVADNIIPLRAPRR